MTDILFLDGQVRNKKIVLGQDLPELLESFITMNAEQALLDHIIFNPVFLYMIKNEFPELAKAGYQISITETETKEGKVISGEIRKAQFTFSVGSVLITPEGKTKILGGVKTYPDLIRFIRETL